MKKIDSYKQKGARPDMWLKWDEDSKEYSDIPKTAHKFFINEYEKVKKYIPWKEWKEENLAHFQDVLIHRYIEEDFYLIAIGWHTKRPTDEWSKPKNRLDEISARRHALMGGNLAVVCNRSHPRLVGIDFDTKSVPKPFDEFMSRTLVTSTPRGYHLYFKNSKKDLPDEFVNKLDEKYSTECRASRQYLVLPLSVNKEGKIYEFINWKKPILDLKNLLEVM